MAYDPQLPLSTDYRYPAGHGINIADLAGKRLARMQSVMRDHNLGACLFFDPINIRYSTESSNMQVWILHNFARYVFVPAEGACTLFDFHNCEHLSNGFDTIREVRRAHGVFYFSGGEGTVDNCAHMAAEINDLMQVHCPDSRRLGVDTGNSMIFHALAEQGISVQDGQRTAELARIIKLPEEIAAMRIAIRVCEEAMTEMEQALVPGMTEAALWAHLHAANITRGGEWIETRLLSSGPRTNPWFQEASQRPIQEGDMVSYDTDLVGPFGYCADLSRSLVCGDKVNGEQRTLFALAREQIEYNLRLLKPGMRFSEFGRESFVLPDRYMKNRYSAVAHGIGMIDEYPHIGYPIDVHDDKNDGIIEPGMTLCIESLIGDEAGGESVKLEQQVLITSDGIEVLSSHPFNAALGG